MAKDEGAEVKVAEDAAQKANELGVDPTKILGTGQEGAVTVQDVHRAAAKDGGSKSAVVLTLDELYGPGEASVDVEGENIRIPAGVEVPVTKAQADALKDDNGEYMYPIVEAKKEDS